MRVVALTVSYDGAGMAGFARQPGLQTVQGRLEQALGTALREDVLTTGAGRTDAGVHALGQVVSFDTAKEDLDLGVLTRSLNALLGEGVRVTSACFASPGFSARHSALRREYRYRIVPGPVPPVFLAGYSWWVKGALDLAAIREAAPHLVGEHDFRSFCVTESADLGPTVREVERIEIGPDTELGEHCVVVRVVGKAFLHSMVRVIVGSLFEVGRGRREPVWMGEVLAARDRKAAGQTAPARGLTLWHVGYPDDVWL